MVEVALGTYSLGLISERSILDGFDAVRLLIGCLMP